MTQFEKIENPRHPERSPDRFSGRNEVEGCSEQPSTPFVPIQSIRTHCAQADDYYCVIAPNIHARFWRGERTRNDGDFLFFVSLSPTSPVIASLVL